MKPKIKILITGFEPFLDIPVNPSQLLMESISQDIKGAQKVFKKDTTKNKESFMSFESLSLIADITTLILPVDYDLSFKAIEGHIEAYKPDVIICTGVAKDRTCVNIERLAINYRSLDLPDSSGLKPRSKKLYDHAPDAYFSNLDVDKIADQVSQSINSKDRAFQFKVSNTAGTYVCNALLFKALHTTAQSNSFKVGFIHVPQLADTESINSYKNIIYNVVYAICELEF